MKHFGLVLLLLPQLLAAQDFESLKIPGTWDKDFTISLFSGAGMRFYSETVEFNFQESVTTIMDQGKETVTRHSLTPEIRSKILKKLKDLRIDKVQTLHRDITIYDMGTTRIQWKKGDGLGGAEVGATQYLTEKDSAIFKEAYNFLKSFFESPKDSK